MRYRRRLIAEEVRLYQRTHDDRYNANESSSNDERIMAVRKLMNTQRLNVSEVNTPKEPEDRYSVA